MTKITKNEKRLLIFRYGAKAAAKYRNGDCSLYFCPICKIGYDESSVINGELTLEDVPPKSIGGKPILLTCHTCNSRAGYTIDSAIANRNKLQDFTKIVSGQKKGIVPSVELSFGDLQIKTSINVESTFDIRPVEKANAPHTIEKYKNHLMDISNSGGDGFEFKLSKTLKCDERLAKLGYLKSAFLLTFAWLGYRYAFDSRLDIVRQQIQKPENVITGTKFWIEDIKENISSNKIMFSKDPLPLFLISFQGFCIILPSLEFKGDTYSLLQNYWKKGDRVNIQAKILNTWPDQLQMKLDYAQIVNTSP
jgi:hypothetical protein